MNKRDHEVIAAGLRDLRWHNRHEVIDGLMLYFKDTNPCFDAEKFAKVSQYKEKYAQAPWRHYV